MTVHSNKLPSAFLERMQGLLGTAESHRFVEALQTPAPTSIRLNALKTVDVSLLPIQHPVPYSDFGYFLSHRPSFTADPLFHAGAYYVQEASSMALEQVISQIQWPEKPFLAIDVCAAPGGKSTHLRTLMPSNGLLVCNEVIAARRIILQDNMEKWGHPGYAITQVDPSLLQKKKNAFFFAWVDAPCSGEGMFRKDPDAIAHWSTDHVLHCAARQHRILQDVWPSIQPGGYLAYSTCTFSREENEEQIVQLLQSGDAEEIHVSQLVQMGAIRGTPGYRFYPQFTKGEGFYVCLLRKKGVAYENIFSEKSDRKGKIQSSIPNGILEFMDSNGFSFHQHKDTWYMLPTELESYIKTLPQWLPIVQLGASIGQSTEKGWIPHHGMAMLASPKLNTHDLEFPLDIALTYLQKQDVSTFILQQNTEKGWKRITYKGLGLGWIKHLGNRTNNYYPHHVRIQKDLSK